MNLLIFIPFPLVVGEIISKKQLSTYVVRKKGYTRFYISNKYLGLMRVHAQFLRHARDQISSQ